MENLKRIFGMLDDKVRIYRIHEENEVEQDEFLYCQLMHQIVFGDKGLAQTLGPTWNLIHDPRFMNIEGMMVVERKGIFGGDARIGKQYIDDNGTLNSSVSDLEKYAEILGEGRNFHNVLAHPNPECKVRKWLERIQIGYTLHKPHLSFRCYCPEDQKVDPSTFKDAYEEDIWALIHQECPNRAFNRQDKATAYGDLMYRLIRADLIGLIHDYAETPLADGYVFLKGTDVVSSVEEIAKSDPNGLDHQRVLQEIHILEEALTHRATLRVTATKILKSLGFEKHLEKLTGKEGIELTDWERDGLLQIVYQSDWPENRSELVSNLLLFISGRAQYSYAERLETHVSAAKDESQTVIRGLKNGTIQPINQYTEPAVELPSDITENEVMRYAAIVESLTNNPLKGSLFADIYVPAEQAGEVGVLDLLAPIFDPKFILTEEGYSEMLRAVARKSRSLRVLEETLARGTEDVKSTPSVTIVEGEL